MNTLSVKNLSISHLKTKDDVNSRLVGPLNFDIKSGQILTLMGASGVGKSTVLNWLIGAAQPTFNIEGEAILGDVRIDLLPTEKRRVGILFQEDLLFPHFNVGENLAYALPAEVRGKSARRAAIETILDESGLGGFCDRDPSTLSGGQRARISLLRTLVAEPQALLMDEPFSKLDTALRQQFRQFVYERVQAREIPTLLVTHDAEDIPDGGEVLELLGSIEKHV
ncbi:ATP-binding cassette domain-containing protein [Leucothrix arctica]|uniref:ABC transporter ATP-binding protein n=1 Tax=Leucothrix arctica TaxID=1481894 RepID=A0A317C5N1_9GAMM|nr:ATP-binding cassette domain-containing protein [Leucothrix arctica]PWQ93627.1 ABC transporter ATP-binding protein [Leucothrix arctica]